MRKLYLLIRAIPKTLYVNFKYLPFKRAIRLPIFVSHRVWLMKTKGRIYIEDNCTLRPAMIKLGFGEVAIFDQMKERSVLQLEGELVFKGGASIGHGCKISVGSSGRLSFGEGIIITAESSIICNKKINIGEKAMISWETLIMDTDLHPIIDELNNVINMDEEIIIGKKTWIGCRCLILKGSVIKEGSIIAAGTTVSKSMNKEGQGRKQCLFAGNPPRAVKENVKWQMQHLQ